MSTGVADSVSCTDEVVLIQVPDYSKANENWAQGVCAQLLAQQYWLCSFLQNLQLTGRTVIHPAGSLGEIVTNLVKVLDELNSVAWHGRLGMNGTAVMSGTFSAA